MISSAKKSPSERINRNIWLFHRCLTLKEKTLMLIEENKQAEKPHAKNTILFLIE